MNEIRFFFYPWWLRSLDRGWWRSAKSCPVRGTSRWRACNRMGPHRPGWSSSALHDRWPMIRSSTRPCNRLLSPFVVTREKKGGKKVIINGGSKRTKTTKTRFAIDSFHLGHHINEHRQACLLSRSVSCYGIDTLTDSYHFEWRMTDRLATDQPVAPIGPKRAALSGTSARWILGSSPGKCLVVRRKRRLFLARRPRQSPN